MINERQAWLEMLAQIQEMAAAGGKEFLDQYHDDIEAYRQQISLGIDEALAQMRRDVSDISAGNLICEQLTSQTSEYISWMKWALWDLPYFAVALRPSLDFFKASVTACGLVYLSIRIFDDVIDQHFWYKGRHQTILAAANETITNGQSASGLTILAGLLVCFEGLSHLAQSDQPAFGHMLQNVIGSIRRAVIGAIMEYSQSGEWNHAFYERLVQLKNVDYWRALYASLDPEQTSPLYPFLQEYYSLTQYLNDVQDFDEDFQQGQPNLVSLYLKNGRDGQPACPPFQKNYQVAPLEVEQFLVDKFATLAKIVKTLPSPEKDVAQFKLLETLEIAYRLGLFSPDEDPVIDFPSLEPSLFWYSDIESVVVQAGSNALEQVSCGVCDTDDGQILFQKQGFSYRRCQECSHIYVSPRIRPDVQEKMMEELDDLSFEDKYMEVQRFFAEWICQFLRDRASGARFLDIGFGQGYLMRLAQAYGFEVFGIDSSEARVQQLMPIFGQRIIQGVVGKDPIPWRDFDVVVMSHVLEHLPQPQACLEEIKSLMNPSGVLYVAVPDMESVHFQIFGKKWDVVNPLVHFQYFNEKSLSQLLEGCGFEALERMEHPQMPEELIPRWMRLMRHLGGSEVSELAMAVKMPAAKPPKAI